MLTKKSVLTASIAIAALGMSAAAVADTAYAAPASGSFFGGTDAGFVVGIQGGYADQHWDNLFSPAVAPANVKDTGFSARGFVGYDINKMFGVETGYTYFPKTTISGVQNFDIKNYAVDLLAKLSVPVTNVFSVYAKAGGSYLDAKADSTVAGVSNSSSHSHIGPAFGVGAAYEVVPNLAVDLSWMRYSGQGHTVQDNQMVYQSSPDAVFLGVSYKFPARYS